MINFFLLFSFPPPLLLFLFLLILYSLHDGDNDGLWTGMFVSGLIHQYALGKQRQQKQQQPTLQQKKNEIIRTLAWKHYSAIEFLHNVTNTHGFLARTAVRCGESHGSGDSGICPSGAPNSCGWVNSSVCYNGVDEDSHSSPSNSCCWIWKRDTSSDEVTGHFFTMLQAYLYLAETKEEKNRVRVKLCDTADYLIQGTYQNSYLYPCHLCPFFGSRMIESPFFFFFLKRIVHFLTIYFFVFHIYC